MADSLEFVVIAHKARPRGNRGEIEATPLSASPERAKRVFINAQPFQVERVFRHGYGVVYKLKGIDSISAAEQFAGADICIAAEERLVLPDGEYYQSDLIGCEVFEHTTGRLVGTVREWQEYGGPPLLEVGAPDGKEILIPFARSICVSIDSARKRIEVILPEGLEEI